MKSPRHPGRRSVSGLGDRALLGFLAAFAALGWSGCHTSASMGLGKRAEERGCYHIAYRHYCDEAKRAPSNPGVQAAIARVAPEAAQHYACAGAEARDAGDYARAWKLCMRALMITPEDTALSQLIEMLEQHHSGEVASARRAWERYGAATLAVGPMVDQSEARPGSVRSVAEWSEGERPERQAEGADPVGGRPRVAQVGLQRPAADDDVGTNGAIVAAETSEPGTPMTPENEADASAREETVEYLMTAILSVEDRRFGRQTHALDDLHVRLRDTDPEPDADLDIYLGTTRVKKARDVEPGHGVRVRGRSGKLYDVVLITIVDRTESVRLGIRPVGATRG
ncbi:MAG: hypothetical protein GY842_29240 [bacterium]|nr:hypothetical protein [bacterium]